MLKNKKANVPVTILVIGVLAVCLLAIISFYNKTNSVNSSFEVINFIDESRAIEDEFLFYMNQGLSGGEAINLVLKDRKKLDTEDRFKRFGIEEKKYSLWSLEDEGEFYVLRGLYCKNRISNNRDLVLNFFKAAVGYGLNDPCFPLAELEYKIQK